MHKPFSGFDVSSSVAPAAALAAMAPVSRSFGHAPRGRKQLLSALTCMHVKVLGEFCGSSSNIRRCALFKHVPGLFQRTLALASSSSSESVCAGGLAQETFVKRDAALRSQ